MVSSVKVTVVERFAVSPPPRSVPPTSLPLTFLDIPWLLFYPTQPLFFYDFPISTTAHFTQTILPYLRQTLSLTLQHFFPFAGNLVMPPPPHSAAAPHLEYTEDDSVLLTVAEASSAAGDFKNLAANHWKTARDFHSLVPPLSSSGGEGSRQQLLAVQITVFPRAGISMGFTLRHVAADWRTFNNFLRRWASLCKNGESPEFASHDRSVIKDTFGLKSTFLKDWWNVKIRKEEANSDGSTCENLVRSSFVLGPKEMETIKKWILTRSKMLFGSTQLLLSSYVLTCAFLWVCWVKTQWSTTTSEENNIHYFGFVAGGMTRFRYTVPNNYAGNYVGFGRSSATRSELLGENGIVFAAKAIGDTIKKLNADMLGGAENWISEWKVLRESELHITVTGSPKVDIYGLDFGWGRPVKMEDVSIDATCAISLCECREVVGGVEIGVALPKSKMDDFTNLFNKGLIHYSIIDRE